MASKECGRVGKDIEKREGNMREGVKVGKAARDRKRHGKGR